MKTILLSFFAVCSIVSAQVVGVGKSGLIRRVWDAETAGSNPAACTNLDRYSCLSMLESNDNDDKVGGAGEVGRFQITPKVWHQYTSLPLSSAKNPFTSENVAKAIMSDRIKAFASKNHRQPTAAEWYGLWSRPSRSTHLRPKELERAKRFQNLSQRVDKN